MCYGCRRCGKCGKLEAMRGKRPAARCWKCGKPVIEADVVRCPSCEVRLVPESPEMPGKPHRRQ